jgi:hypothetical protein
VIRRRNRKGWRIKGRKEEEGKGRKRKASKIIHRS